MTPIPSQPVLSQLDHLRRLIEGREVLVVGSAPLPTSHAQDRPGDVVIAVNGGISSCAGIPAVWFLNSKDQDRPGTKLITPLHRAMIEQATNRRIEHLVLLRGAKVASEAGTLAHLAQLCCRWESWSVLDKSTKAHIEADLCGRDLRERKPCSSGIFAATVALWCGASRVRLEGFSWVVGLHYKTPTRVPFRGHELADKRALKALHARFGDKLQTSLLKRKAA